MSGSADGLVRLWTIRTGECENTFDEHQDKVWAIAVCPESYAIPSVSGVDTSNAPAKAVFTVSSDSRILLWRDCTVAEEQNRLQLLEKELLLQQELDNDLRNRRFGKVIEEDFLRLNYFFDFQIYLY